MPIRLSGSSPNKRDAKQSYTSFSLRLSETHGHDSPCVKKIVTDLAVLEVDTNRGFILLERAPGVSVEEIIEKTAGRLIVEGDVPEMTF